MTRAVPGTRAAMTGAAISAALVATLAGAAHAQDQREDESADVPQAESADRFLIGVAAPRVSGGRLLAIGFGGYDSSRHSVLVGAEAEAALTSWLGLRGGFVYVPQGQDNATMRPSLGLRAQLLNQSSHGIDGALGVGYRQERFAEDGGLFEATASIGRSLGRLTAVANFAYAMDPEGDDFEGTARAALLCRVLPAINLGLQGSVRRDLGSSDARRATRIQPDQEIVAGPVVTHARAGWVFTLHGGVSAMTGGSTTGGSGGDTTRVGGVAVAGAGTTF
jgi:hypothetical protein